MVTVRRPEPQQIERGVELIQTHNEQEEKAKENEKERHEEVMERLENNFNESREEIARTHLGFEQIEELAEDIKQAFEDYQNGANPENINQAFQEHVRENLEGGGHPKDAGQCDRTFSIREDGIHRYRQTRNSMLKPSTFTEGGDRADLKEALEAQDAWETAEELINAHDALQNHNKIHVGHEFDEGFEVGHTEWVELHAAIKLDWHDETHLEVTMKTAHYTRNSYEVPADLINQTKGLELYVTETEEIFRLLESLLEKTEEIRRDAEGAVEQIGVEL